MDALKMKFPGLPMERRFSRLGWIGVTVWALILSIPHFVSGQNSTKTKRVQPNEISAKVGSAIQWSKSIAAAVETSRKSGKPIFWYVSTVPGTFMDRKPVIDRYMLGGPFSWPPLIKLINENFVPLKVVPSANDQKLGIRPYQFVEPGFLILDADKKVLRKVDRLSTFHYGWLEQLLVSELQRMGMGKPDVDSQKYFAEFALESDQWIDPVGEGYAKNASNLLLSGMIAFRKGDHELAKKRWGEASQSEPESPLAWKASLEAQGIGPFVRGFEVFRAIPDKAKKAGLESPGSAAPKGTYSQEQMIDRSVEFLLGMQRNDGGFVDSDYDFGGFDSLPNVHVAVSSLVGMALLKAAERQKNDRLDQAILGVEKFVANKANINLADRDEILWAYAYRLRFISRLEKSPLKASVKDFAAKKQAYIEALENIQLKTGNWYHEYNNPFVTATALCALFEAKQGAGEIDTAKINKGIDSLLLDRNDNGTYPYYSVRRKTSRNQQQQEAALASSAGRMPLCELALVRWGRKKQAHLVAAVENSLKQHRHLASGYKYDNHTSNMAYGGFFFWYDMRSRSEAIRAIDNEEFRKKFQDQHQQLIDNLPEVDGCFVDSHELGRCYGTAMALLSMEF